MPESEDVVTVRDVIKNYTKYVPSSYTRLLKKLFKDMENAVKARHRRMLVVSGSDPYTMGALVARALIVFDKFYRLKLKRKEELPVLYVFHHEFGDARIRKDIVKEIVKEKTKSIKLKIIMYEESETYLGTTFKALVLDLVNDLKPNDLGRLVGTVEGGGLVILMVPSWKEWDTMMTLFKKTLTIPQKPEPRHIFITWVKRKIMEHEGIYVYDADARRVLKAAPYEGKEYIKRELKIPEKRIFPLEVYSMALTQDQVNVIKLLEELVEKPRKRVAIVITADRGRGKSCATGIGVVGLIHELLKVKHRVRVLVTAPSASNVQSLMELASKTLDKLGYKYKVIKRGGKVIELNGERFSIEYWEPINIPKMSADIVVVDEAAGIHVPLLHSIWLNHKRTIFATTIHGYEGAGRGFSVRFLKRLKEDSNTRLYLYEMEEPIRYARDDPIETWQFKTLLLDAEPAELDERDLEAIKKGEFKYIKPDPEWLFSKEGEETLRQLFGIYVLAHYRNEPDDLGMMADAPHHMVRALVLPSRKVVCSVQLAEEGPIPDDMIDDLLKGGRIPGNIIPDRFLKHLRIRDFAKTKGLRIVRIATHPSVQGKGIGSRMLEEIFREALEKGYDWVGSGFGVNEQLLRFWLKNGFLPVHLSPDRHPVSGEYTILVLKPISTKVKEMVEIANREFRWKLLNSLHDTYRDLETEVALMILRRKEPIIPGYKPRLTKIQQDRLWIYSYGPMTYEAACDIMHELAKAYWLMSENERPELSDRKEYILVAKILQGRSWDRVADELKTRRVKVMEEVKEIARIMLKHFYGRDENSKPGVELRYLTS